jgi:hypothetical protein
MPQPSFGDIREFCRIDGWDEKKSAKGKTGDHFRYRKVLADGRIVRTKASHGNDQIGDPSLWERIWRDQLGLESEEHFWEALRTKRPVDRGTADAQPPAGETVPLWLVRRLVLEVGVPEAEVRRLTREEAQARLDRFYEQLATKPEQSHPSAR